MKKKITKKVVKEVKPRQKRVVKMADIVELEKKVEEVLAEEPKVEIGPCLRCGGRKHEPTNDCDAMQ